MKTLFWAFGLATLAAAIAVAMQGNGGSIVALVPPWRIDLSLNLFLLAGLGALWLAYQAGRLLQRLSDFPERVRAYRERRSELGALRGLREALKALFEGRFARAERAAQRAQEVPPVAGLAALVGARAAHRMQEYERREQWLERAEQDPDLAMARLVLSAEMWSEQRDSVRALKVIEQLHGAGARHIHAMRIALVAHLQSNHWDDALRIVRALDKHRGLPAPASSAYRVLAYRGLLRDNAQDLAGLERTWNGIPAADRTVPELALDAARMFNRLGRGDSAAQALEQALQRQWHDGLLDEYARCAGVPVPVALGRLEKWLQVHGPSGAALRCMGRICLRGGLWGKAREYLDDSRRLEDAPDTALALAELARAVGDEALAAEQFRIAAEGLARRDDSAAGAAAGRVRWFRREPTV